jgi:hypothetical protein
LHRLGEREVRLSRHGHGKMVIDAYIEVPQRVANCQKCGTSYHGPKDKVKCKGCGKMLTTGEMNCVKKIPAGVWNVTTMRK